MRTLSYNLLKAKTIDCTFRADESLNGLKLPMDIRRNFYLIFKEALNNLVKYSNATRASVLVSHENKRVTFIIRDDGVGFDNRAAYNGNGLNNMRRRAKEINAVLNIESSIGKGTSIELSLAV
jgi:signal transduction histidine kinase